MRILNHRVTYKTAPIPILEKLRFKDIQAAYKRLLDIEGVDECVIIQTCNRVEIFSISESESPELSPEITMSWALEVGVDEQELLSFLEHSAGDEALEHLLRLASGLESMIIGEDQILGQVKDAYEAAQKFDAARKLCQLIFERAIRAGAKVRAYTRINKGNVSAGSAAVEIAEQTLGQLRQRKTLLIGAGEMAISVAKALLARGQSEIYVASRTYERAKAFTEIVGGHPIEFLEAVQKLSEVDLVITATSAPYYLLTYEMIAPYIGQRAKGLLIFDLSNPRNVEDRIKDFPNVQLLNIDHLRRFADDNLESRLREVQKTESIIRTELDVLRRLIRRETVEPEIASIFRHAETTRRGELGRALSMLNGIPQEDVKIIDQMTQVLVKRLLSQPALTLRTAAESGDIELVSAARKLFAEAVETLP